MFSLLTHTHTTDERGFSITELLLVVAIMGIMAAIAVPNMTQTLRDFRLTQSTNSVLGALRTARANAIKEFREVRAYVDLDQERIKFKICSGSGDCDQDADLKFVNYDEMQTINVMDGVNLYGIRHNISHDAISGWHWETSGIHPLEFLPTGTKSFESMLITYNPTPATTTANACDFNTIMLSSTGQPRIVRSADDTHSNTSYGAYTGSSGPYDIDFKTAPTCAE